jgi:hypothetical protein
MTPEIIDFIDSAIYLLVCIGFIGWVARVGGLWR